MNNGNVNNENRNNNNNARAVSEFLNEYTDAMYHITLESLFEAYWDCRRNKSRTKSAAEFEVHYEKNLIQLHKDISDGSYIQREATTFVITKPDYREIFASHFRDRIVHHWIRQRIEPLFEQELIPTTFNCRKGKGTLAAQMYARDAIKAVSHNYTSDCYVMKLDIKGFFMSIDRKRICNKVIAFVADKYNEEDADALLFLLRKVLLNAPEYNCQRRGNVKLWRHIKPHKSLFTNGDGQGLPIGDLIVQMAANLLLNDADHFITETLGITMARYVDDMLLISDNKQQLLDAIPMIREYLKRTAGVTLHPNKFYMQHYTKGVKFIGAVIKPYRTYISNRTVNNAFRCVRKLNKQDCSADEAMASINSYLGLLRHHATFNIRRRLLGKLDPRWLKKLNNNEYEKVTIKSSQRHREKIKQRLKQQRNGNCRQHNGGNPRRRNSRSPAWPSACKSQNQASY